MKLEINKLSIENRHGEILEIETEVLDGFVNIIIDGKIFSLESIDELDFLYNKLREQLEYIEKKQNAETD